jgi:hypothetical protein
MPVNVIVKSSVPQSQRFPFTISLPDLSTILNLKSYKAL